MISHTEHPIQICCAEIPIKHTQIGLTYKRLPLATSSTNCYGNTNVMISLYIDTKQVFHVTHKSKH